MAGAMVYVDGQNFRGSARDYFGDNVAQANLPKLCSALLNASRLDCAGIRYYTGIYPRQASTYTPARAREIVRLDHLKNQGVTTFANDLVVNELGRFKEVGIDVKLAADLLLDVLTKRTDTVVLLSNDRDYEPVFDMLRALATAGHVSPVRAYVVACGSSHAGCANVPKIQLPPAFYARYVEDHQWLEAEAKDRLSRDGDAALDASAHGRMGAAATQPPATSADHGSTAHYLDVSSIGAMAKAQFHRPYMDASLQSLLQHIVSQTDDLYPSFVHLYLNTHTDAHDLTQSQLARDIGRSLEPYGVHASLFPYAYAADRVGTHRDGLGEDTPIRAMVPREKRMKTAILCDVVRNLVTGRHNDFALWTDDHNLWPLRDVAATFHVRVHNMHIGDHAIDGMISHPVSQAVYEQSLDPINRLERARTRSLQMLENDLDTLKTQLGDDRATSPALLPHECVGILAAVSHHWAALQVEDGSHLYVRRDRMPARCDVGATYQLGVHSAAVTSAPILAAQEPTLANGKGTLQAMMPRGVADIAAGRTSPLGDPYKERLQR